MKTKMGEKYKVNFDSYYRQNEVGTVISCVNDVSMVRLRFKDGTSFWYSKKELTSVSSIFLEIGV